MQRKSGLEKLWDDFKKSERAQKVAQCDDELCQAITPVIYEL
jgi:hypothetical protein